MMMRGSAALVALFVPASAIAEPLWQNVESGMTLAQVRKAQPDAQPSSPPISHANGAACELTIPSISVEGNAYKVCFYMLNGRLDQVMLSALHPSQALFNATVALLREKYGSELAADQPRCSTTDAGFTKTCTANWLLRSGTRINAVFLAVAGTGLAFDVAYQTKLAKDASKL